MARIVTADQYTTLPARRLHWIIPKFLGMPSLTVLIGEPFGGKSFLALQLGLAIARGQPFFGQATKQGSVLYLQFDTPEFIWRNRLQTLKESGVDITGPLYMIHPDENLINVNILNPLHFELLGAAIRDANPSLVIVDVWREIHQQDEQDSTAMKIVGDALMRLVAGRAVLVLHHPHKLNDDVPPKLVNAARGTSYLPGKADSLWLLHKGHLYVESRTDTHGKYRAVRLSNGFWQFPELSS